MSRNVVGWKEIDSQAEQIEDKLRSLGYQVIKQPIPNVWKATIVAEGFTGERERFNYWYGYHPITGKWFALNGAQRIQVTINMVLESEAKSEPQS